MKRLISILLLLALSLSLLPVVAYGEQVMEPVTDAAEAAASDVPLYLYAEDGDGIRHYMRQTRGAAASSHGYAEKVVTTSPYSLYTTTVVDEAAPYCVVSTQCNGETEYFLQFHDAAANKDYVLYILTSGVGPNSLTGTTHAKHHFLWDAENKYFYQLEGSTVYVLVMKYMDASYAAAGSLPAMTQKEWRITALPVAQLETEGVYPVGLAYHSHSYTVPVKLTEDPEHHRLDCACGSEGTVLEEHSYGENGSCACGKREAVALQEGIYYLKAAINGTTYYFRKTVSGESVTNTTPYSLYATTSRSSATLVDVISESSGGYSLAYPYNSNLARIYVYDVGNNGTVDTGANTKNEQANHHFLWDAEAQVLYQTEGQVNYVLAMKQLKNSATGVTEYRVQAVPESALGSTVVPVSLEAHTEHSCDTWVVVTPPTTSADGLKTGTCTVCGRQMQEVIPALIPEFCGKSITLQDDFSIRFHVEQAAFADGVYANPHVVFRMDGRQMTVSDYILQDGCYVFTFGGITPDKLGQTVTATLYADKQDGTQVSATTTYSVAQYCYDALAMEKTGDALRKLLVDTLNFGAACQQYRNGDNQTLVNAQLTQQQQGYGSGETLRELESCRDFGGNNGEISWHGVSALMTNRVQMRVYFAARDIDDLTVKAVSGEQSWTLTDIKSKDGVYYVDFGVMNPAQMQEQVSFTVYRGEEAVSTTMHYSIESYAAAWLGREEATDAHIALIKALIHYGDSAREYIERTYDLQEDVLYMGRTYETNGTHWFNWSAAGFCVRFQGSGVKAKIASSAPNAQNYSYLKVYVDGVEQTDILLDKTMQTVVLAEGLDPEATHTVEVRKRNSPRSSTAGVVGLELLDGEKLAPAEAKDRLIEFVGDSLTVGYSAGDADRTSTAWSTAIEDGTKTYSKQVADALNAEYMVTAISGRGVVMNNDGGSGYLFPEIYPELDIYNRPGVAYDFAAQPDVIVINLGTNDATNEGLDITAFQNGVSSFIKSVRQHNPNAYILWAYGLRSDKKTAEVAAAIQAAIASVNAEGDAKVQYVPLALATQMHLNHPTAAAYIPAGETLIEAISELTGW